VTQFGPRDRSVRYKLKFKDIQDGGGRHPKKLKLRYLGNGLTDRHSIWQDDAYWPSEPDQLKFRTFKNLKWRRAAIVKNRKM